MSNKEKQLLQPRTPGQLINEIEKLKAENEQLKSWKEETLYNIPHIDKTKDSADKEIEKLKIDNKKWKEEFKRVVSHFMSMDKEIRKLKAELERVKGIAKKVCEYYERVANTEEICIGDFARTCMKELDE